MTQRRRGSRFGNGRMNGVLRGLGQEFEDMSPGGTTVGVDTVASADMSEGAVYAAGGDVAPTPTEEGDVFATGGDIPFPDTTRAGDAGVTVMNSFPSFVTPDMLNKLIAVGGKVYKMVQDSGGNVVPRATGQTVAAAPSMTINSKTLLIGAAIAYLLFA